MKKKFLGRVLTMLLVASMVFTLLPAPAIAAGSWWWNTDEAESLADTTDSILPHRIIHLDCGRKYFSVDNVRSLIDVMAAYGYNELELAFGNDGLRFLLGDMSISFEAKDGTTTSYSDGDIRTAVVKGNENQNSSGDGSYWTEADMTQILDYAKGKGIEIVPLLNMPGHMKALLDGEKFHQYRISGNDKNYSEQTSKDSIDPANSDAVAFGLAILQKYVNWFEAYNNSHPDGKVKYFNFGADEVGNDIVNPFYGYNYGYSSCAEYINKCAAIIKNAGMTPRAFNDLLYYGSNYTTGVDKSVQVCYWSDQWSGSPYITARSMKEQGHQMINTNSEWYYVLGVKENNLSYALNSVDKYEYNDFYERSGNSVVASRIADTAGVMLCIWCDNPNAAKPETAIAEATQLFAKFAEKNSAVFPAKGEIPPTPQPEPTEPTTKDIYVTVSQTYTETIDGNYPGDHATKPTGIATVTGEVIPSTTETQTLGSMYEVYNYNRNQSATGVISDEKGNFLKIDKNGSCVNTNVIAEATRFKYTRGYYNTIQIDDSRCSRNGYYLNGTSGLAVNAYPQSWTAGKGHDFSVSDNYLSYTDNTWKLSDLNTMEQIGWNCAGRLYEVNTDTTPTATQTKLTFTGVAPGDTEVTFGNVTYKVHVTDAPVDNGDLYVDFWVTSSMITPKGIAATNQGGHIYATYTKDLFSSEDGVLLSNVIPQDGTYQTGTGTSATYHDATYWKTRYLPNECRQKDEGWTNKNGVGTDTLTEGKGGRDVERIRYWEGKWQYLAVKGGEWTTFTTSQDTSGNQMAAYYVIKTDVTKEVTTYVTDWSDKQTEKMYGVALDFCVKYPSQDTRVPATFKNANTQWFNCEGEEGKAYSNGYSIYASKPNANVDVGSWKGMRTSYPTQGDWYRVINHIEVTEDHNYEVYMITATPSTSFSDATYKLSCPDNIKYTGTERVLWAKNESVVTDSGLTKHSDYKMGGSPVIERVMIQQCSGMLLTYYVRPKTVTNPLTVHFREKNAATDFASYQIIPQVADTTFDPNIALPDTDDRIGDLTNATIKNDVGVDQTVTSDLREVPGVPTQYRKTAFKCVGLSRTDDLREITLYYTFDNSVAFVADFGLPLTITPKDVNSNLIAENITGAAVSGGNGLTVDTSNPKAIVVTPNKDVASKTSTSFNLTYTGTKNSAESVTYLVYILHASNVLYEENFLTQSNESGRTDWTEFKFGTAQQQTQKLKEQQTFGFDTAYEGVTSAQGYWTATGLTTKADSTRSLATNFYGNAIDVIGSCGPKTGIVMVSIKNAETGKPVKSVVIETTYTAGTIDQVPLAHIELGEGNANYTAVIRGYAPLDAAQQQSGSLMLAADYYGGSYDALAADLAEMGLSLSDVEFIRASGAAAKTASTRRAAQAYALETVAEGSNSDNTVTIDGFRVYRSANNEAYKELTNEYQVTYNNILKVMNGQVITAYVDNKTVTDCDVSKYEKQGGPQNEIYLQNKQVIVFKLLDSSGNAAANRDIQISLSAVSGETQYNSTKKISSTMEMYYTLTTNDKGIVTIMNTGDNLLAIGNVKVPAGCTTVAPRNLDTQELVRSINLALNAAPETPDVGFAPAISAKVTTTRFIRSKVVTLTVSASSDVEKLMVNGVELRPTNSWLVKMGWSDTYTYILTEKVQKNEIKTYEIVGYRADGAASETIVVKSK